MDQTEIIRRAVELGCTVENRTKHIRLTTPNGNVHTFSKSSRSPVSRDLQNSIANLRRSGIDVRPRKEIERPKPAPVRTVFCAEERCARLSCGVNLLGVDPRTHGADGPKIDKLEKLRSDACGYMPLTTCESVEWVDDSEVGRFPRFCTEERDHYTEHVYARAETESETVAKAGKGKPRPTYKRSKAEHYYNVRPECIALAEDGKTHDAIAKAQGVSQATVSRWVAIAKENGTWGTYSKAKEKAEAAPLTPLPLPAPGVSTIATDAEVAEAGVKLQAYRQARDERPPTVLPEPRKLSPDAANEHDEIDVMRAVVKTMEKLPADARMRVMAYLTARYAR